MTHSITLPRIPTAGKPVILRPTVISQEIVFMLGGRPRPTIVTDERELVEGKAKLAAYGAFFRQQEALAAANLSPTGRVQA